MNIERLMARILHAIADEFEPDPPAPGPASQIVGNDPPLEVASWQPNDIEHHGLGFHER